MSAWFPVCSIISLKMTIFWKRELPASLGRASDASHSIVHPITSDAMFFLVFLTLLVAYDNKHTTFTVIVENVLLFFALKDLKSCHHHHSNSHFEQEHSTSVLKNFGSSLVLINMSPTVCFPLK